MKADANYATWVISVWEGEKEVKVYSGKVNKAEVFDVKLFAFLVTLVIVR